MKRGTIMKGRFVTFEGADGAGKTTALKRLFSLITPELRKRILLTREPGGNSIAEQIRRVILAPRNVRMDPKTEALLYAAARRQHLVQTIVPALCHGQLVFCDRYVDSSIAYQGGGRKLGDAFVRRLNQSVTGGLQPELTIYFCLPVRVGLDRINHHRTNDIDRLDRETVAFHQRVHVAYQRLVKQNPRRIKVVDATQSVSKVTDQVLQILNRHFQINFEDYNG